MKMRKMLAVLLCMMMAGALCACGARKPATDTSSAAKDMATDNQSEAGEEPGALIGGRGGVRIANPWTECASLEEAAKQAGFSLDTPETSEGFEIAVIRVLGNEMMEVIYEKGDEMISVRKAMGVEDAGGDYNEYAEVNTVTVGELTVTEKGEAGKVMLAIWTSGEYSYAVSFPGVPADTAEAWIGQIK